MSLYCLVVVDPRASNGLAVWYFDSHAQFLRATSEAKLNNIFVSERHEFITDLDEFRSWLRQRARESV